MEIAELCHYQQLAAMATVAKTAEKALRENRDKVNEVFGEREITKGQLAFENNCSIKDIKVVKEFYGKDIKNNNNN